MQQKRADPIVQILLNPACVSFANVSLAKASDYMANLTCMEVKR